MTTWADVKPQVRLQPCSRLRTMPGLGPRAISRQKEQQQIARLGEQKTNETRSTGMGGTGGMGERRVLRIRCGPEDVAVSLHGPRSTRWPT